MPVSGDESLTSEKIEIADKLENSDKATVIVIFALQKFASIVPSVVKDTGSKFTIWAVTLGVSSMVRLISHRITFHSLEQCIVITISPNITCTFRFQL